MHDRIETVHLLLPQLCVLSKLIQLIITWLVLSDAYHLTALEKQFSALKLAYAYILGSDLRQSFPVGVGDDFLRLRMP
jgi:hypothetical protein